MIYVIPHGWYTYGVLEGYKFVTSKNHQDLVVCATCKLNNFDDSVVCLTCRKNK